jgi:hypothetical protein
VFVCPKIMTSLVGELGVRCQIQFCIVDSTYLSIIYKRFAKCNLYE